MPLPLKVTVDFENTVVSAIDETGFARTDNIDAVANSGDQLIVHGLDGAFGWQIVIHQRQSRPPRSPSLRPIR